MALIISQQLQQLLLPINRDLLDRINYNNVKTSVNYLDVKLEGDKPIFTGLPTNSKIVTGTWESPKRTKVKFAALLTKLFAVPESEAKKLQEAIVTQIVKLQSNLTFEIVDGEELRKCYQESHKSRTGNLNSCMAKPHLKDVVDLYVYNSSSIKLAVLRNKKRTLIARGLLFYGALNGEATRS